MKRNQEDTLLKFMKLYTLMYLKLSSLKFLCYLKTHQIFSHVITGCATEGHFFYIFNWHYIMAI